MKNESLTRESYFTWCRFQVECTRLGDILRYSWAEPAFRRLRSFSYVVTTTRHDFLMIQREIIAACAGCVAESVTPSAVLPLWSGHTIVCIHLSVLVTGLGFQFACFALSLTLGHAVAGKSLELGFFFLKVTYVTMVLRPS